jgi:hypothetical protein
MGHYTVKASKEFYRRNQALYSAFEAAIRRWNTLMRKIFEARRELAAVQREAGRLREQINILASMEND